jgi:flagellar biosynthetic protein FliP
MNMDALLKDLNPAMQLLVLMAALTVIPFVFICMTSFLRYVIVFSILKTALGTQQVPPGIVIIGLSMILTFYSMSPVFSEMYQKGSVPYGKTGSIVLALKEGVKPLKNFMMRQTRQSDVSFFIQTLRGKPPATPEDIGIWEIAPAYIMSELKTSFEIGFIIFIPFIVIDLVVANVLLALGMMMLSPTIISLPFKLLIFIAVDGWGMIVHGLVQSFN